MKKVITYGTYDLLHYGHIRLLERAKELGDYLIVGVTADDFDKVRGKINVQQSLIERIEAVKATGIADEIIVEEYEGQKIDDIKRLGVDVFTVGSDWIGKFDYLNEYCQVVYLDRTEGVSSSDIRTDARALRLGLLGESIILKKIINEAQYVNGLQISGIYSDNRTVLETVFYDICSFSSYEELLKHSDAVYIITHPSRHYSDISTALEAGKHVIYESPLTLDSKEGQELKSLANRNNLVLMEGIKTAYSTAYHRMLLLVKGGRIGEVVSVDATCTSLKDYDMHDERCMDHVWNSMYSWGPTGLLPVFQILGTGFNECRIISRLGNTKFLYDSFSKIELVYDNSVASVKVGQGVKSEGELIISGTKGYVYVPAPWWKTEYFEIRYEEQENNRRYFYMLEGEGIRYELVSFTKAIVTNRDMSYVEEEVSYGIQRIMEMFYKGQLITI